MIAITFIRKESMEMQNCSLQADSTFNVLGHLGPRTSLSSLEMGGGMHDLF